MTPRNAAYVRRLAMQGLSASVVYQRILERLTWDGPYPSFNAIVEICDEQELSALRLRSKPAEEGKAAIGAAAQTLLRND